MLRASLYIMAAFQRFESAREMEKSYWASPQAPMPSEPDGWVPDAKNPDCWTKVWDDTAHAKIVLERNADRITHGVRVKVVTQLWSAEVSLSPKFIGPYRAAVIAETAVGVTPRT